MDLTTFQTSAVARLQSELDARHLRYRIEEVEESNAGPHVLVRAGDATIYLYTNEAGWMLAKHWQPFERPDFASEEQLIDAFVAEVLDVIQTGRSPDASRGTTAVYFGR